MCTCCYSVTPQGECIYCLPDEYLDPNHHCCSPNAVATAGRSAGYCCGGSITATGTCCGDGVCEGGESARTCSADCRAICGDGFCSQSENALSCPQDCPSSCGDGLCTGGESNASCRSDCPLCGDGICSGNENQSTCSQDCPVTVYTLHGSDTMYDVMMEAISAWQASRAYRTAAPRGATATLPARTPEPAGTTKTSTTSSITMKSP